MGALAMAAVLAGCSAIKLGYGALPDVAYWWLDGYLDFTDAQAPRVRDELARLHGWHRESELPRLADMLGRMEQLAPGPVSAAQACTFVAEVRERIVALGDRAEPAIVATALTLTPAQLQHLERRHATNLEDWRSEWIAITPQERLDKRYRQLLDRIEMIYGSLDEPQRAALRASLERSVFDPQRILAERQRRQQDLRQTLRKVADSPPAEARALMRAFFERAQRSPDPDYRRLQDTLFEEGCRMFEAVHAVTTTAQREQAARRLRAYQRDFRELAARR